MVLAIAISTGLMPEGGTRGCHGDWLVARLQSERAPPGAWSRRGESAATLLPARPAPVCRGSGSHSMVRLT